MVPLPCPETLYLGPDRDPGTFLERLNSAEFAALADQLTKQIFAIIKDRGPPLCILGVNSSPTCGVTTTYYGSEGDMPPKRAGRGVFLSRFPEITAMDVATFCRYRIYLAAPLFSEAERSFNTHVAALLERNLFEVFLPQDKGDNSDIRDADEQERLYAQNLAALEKSDIVVAIIDGADADSGTAWEMGYASAQKKPVVALRTDFRRVGDYEQVNLMLEQSSVVVTDTSQLLGAVNSPVNRKTDA
jgi:nucleoside 2-deoxyribosyltransferase